MGIWLALLAAISWGVSDLLGGVATDRQPVTRVLAVSQTVGLLACTLVVLVLGPAMPHGRAFWFAAGAGAMAVLALGMLYVALSRGSAVVVAPIVAAGVAVPVVVGVVEGDPVTTSTWLATGLVVAGVMLASRDPDDADGGNRRSGLVLILALGAAVATGTYLALIDAATRDSSQLGTIEVLRLAAATVAVVTVGVRHLLVRSGRGPDGPVAAGRPLGRTALLLAAVGLSDVTAEIGYAAACSLSRLNVVSVVANMYPVATVGLAFLFLRHRAARVQVVGAILAIAGTMLFAFG